MSTEDFNKISGNIHIELKNEVENNFSFERINSANCQVWLKAGKNVRKEENVTGVTCGECKYLYVHVSRMNQENSSTKKAAMNARLQASSNFSINKLTPRIRHRRLMSASWKRGELQRKLNEYRSKLSSYDILLEDEQNNAMEKVVNWINKNAKNELETSLLESLDKDPEMYGVLQESWLKDTEDRKQFYRDQFTNQGEVLN